MRILIISDIHGFRSRLERCLEEQPEAKKVFFLGDGERDIDACRNFYPDREFFCVHGNCDFGSTLPANILVTIGKKKIFATHGYSENVKYGLMNLQYAARERQADICLFGHTHCPLLEYEYGIMFMNPGSLADEKYGIIDFDAKGEVIKSDLLRLK